MDDDKTQLKRAGGILLHPTSLPSAYGIGDLGPGAQSWLEWLQKSGCQLWQVLPLGPTGYGDSPFQSFSSFAGNPLLISPDMLMEEGLLTQEEIASPPPLASDYVEYGPVIRYKEGLLQIASERFRQTEPDTMWEAYQAFQQSQNFWLDDFALFMALKAAYDGAPWVDWDSALVHREPSAITSASSSYAEAIEDQRIQQFLFFRQWSRVRKMAEERKIQIIGDIPIFVAHDSADVWANQELFSLDKHGFLTIVAGVPPDYFSPTGQLWGNPLYRWSQLQKDGYRWWVQRLQAVLSLVDLVRLDHFRGFEAYWEVPAASPTAETGQWVPGPGADFLASLREQLGDLPIIAEDLGVITPEVQVLRERFGLPGMKVLQFAFDGGSDHEFLPHNYPRRCVVYTGTHDNDTTRGWFRDAPEVQRDFCRRYLKVDAEADITWGMIRMAWASVAERAITPMQDVLNLGSEARMNHPGVPEGNWAWRVTDTQLTDDLAEKLKALNSLYGRYRSEVGDSAEI